MLLTKSTAFSSDNKYFACFTSDEKLLIWKTLSDILIECKYESIVYSTCTSIHWVLPQHKYASPQKGKKARNYLPESHLLAVGTAKGDILLYNVASKNLYSHLVARHAGAVNDMCFYAETNSFFTCSNDKYIAIWDIASGKEKSKWIADESPVSSICAIDDNNLLSASTSILWWNISKKCVIKKFSGHSTEIFKLLPVNAVSLNSCYFLSAAVSDFKINAWSLNSGECQTPVASFVLPEQPEVIDISKISSKDKPLILSTITKNGFLHLFEHTLNGNLNEPIQPKASIEICPESHKASIISAKLSPDSESCIVAYGTSKTNMTFKHIKIRESLKQSKAQNTTSDASMPLDVQVKETSKAAKGLLINGVKSAPTAQNSPRKAHLKEIDTVISHYRKRLRSSSIASSTDEVSDICEVEHFTKSHKSKRDPKSSVKDPTSVDVQLQGLQTQNEGITDAILNNNDPEYITTFVKNLPSSSLNEVLSVLNQRLSHGNKIHSSIVSKWLKEIMRVHLKYLAQSQDTAEALNCIRKQIDSMKISETISKLSILRGFLNLQIQNSSSDESDSENEEPMEL